MPDLSQLASDLKRSGIRVIMDLAMGMNDIVRLEVGEPLFGTPEHIVQAGCTALQDGFTKYTPNAGILSLREIIAQRLNADYSLNLTADNIVITVGGVGAVSSAVRALTDLGDEVLISDPCWPNYEMIIACAGAVPKRYQLDPEQGFLPNLSNIEKALTSKTKVLVINTPSNPLGIVYPQKLMRELVEFARQHDLYVISDEVYEKIIFEGQHSSALSFDSDGRVVGAFSFSKTYAMTGWRVGYAVAAPHVAALITKLQEAYVSCTPGVAQKAAEAALTGSQDCVDMMRDTYKENRRLAREILDHYGIPYLNPQGAFYLWVDVNSQDSTAFAKELLLKHKVAVAPGNTFGPVGERYIRISLASSQAAIEEGLERIGRLVRK